VAAHTETCGKNIPLLRTTYRTTVEGLLPKYYSTVLVLPKDRNPRHSCLATPTLKGRRIQQKESFTINIHCDSLFVDSTVIS
jgi:hypothetical protein